MGCLEASASAQRREQEATEEVQAPAPSSPPQIRIRSVQSGESFGSILTSEGLDSRTISQLQIAAHSVHDLGQIHVGDTLELQFPPQGGDLLRLSYSLDEERTLVLERGRENWSSRLEVTPSIQVTVARAGRVTDTLWEAARRAGLPGEAVVKLAGIFDCRVDFNTEIQPGDTFRVLMEQKTVEGGAPRLVGIAAAEVVAGGKVLRAVRFNDAAGRGVYYSPEGEGLAEPFLKSPIPFGHVGSGFSLKRFHPILHFTRPHRGQDYRAPTGTPIRAVAAGTVSVAGTKGGYGRHIRLDHAGHYGSSYSHLSRYAKGIHPGTRVNQGQIVGYVGSTGLSTAPHLHFEFYVRGKPVDFARQKFPHGEPLEPSRRAEFDEAVAKLLPALLASPVPPSGALAMEAQPSSLAASPSL